MIASALLAFALVSGSWLTVGVHQASPASVPIGAQRVPMLSLSLQASCAGDAALQSLTLHHGGMGSTADMTAVYAVMGTKRLTRGRSFPSSDGPLTLVFSTPVIIPACTAASITVLADFSAEAPAAAEHSLLLRSADDVDAGDARVALQADGGSGVLRTAGPSQGSVSVVFLPLLSRMSYGDRRTVSRLTVAASGSFDQLLDSVILTNDGSARGSDLIHLSLETQSGRALAQAASLQKDRVVFTLDPPLLLPRGKTLRLDVRASVRVGRRRTIGFILEETGDLSARRAVGRSPTY